MEVSQILLLFDTELNLFLLIKIKLSHSGTFASKTNWLITGEDSARNKLSC